jgi:hypothetical protein
MTRQEYVEMLEKGICAVTFKKANGEERDMNATLLAEYLPSRETESFAAVDSSTAAVPVWDVDKKHWRSFRTDRVESFTDSTGRQVLLQE